MTRLTEHRTLRITCIQHRSTLFTAIRSMLAPGISVLNIFRL